MTEIHNTTCCGLNEIEGIAGTNSQKDAKDIIKEVARSQFASMDKCAFYVFTDIGPQKNARTLSKFIQKNKLGTIQKSITKKNPNTLNRLVVYTWAIDRAAFKQWYQTLPESQKEDNSVF